MIMALFEEDENGDWMPIEGVDVDTHFELDGEGDIMPRTAVLDMDIPEKKYVIDSETVFDETTGENVQGTNKQAPENKVELDYMYGPDSGLKGTLVGGGGEFDYQPFTNAQLIHLSRWIFASVCKHFKASITDEVIFIEGQQRDTNELSKWIELRQDGPNLIEVNKDYWHVYVEINLLASATLNATDFHTIYRLVGKITQAFATIKLYRFGEDEDDDSSFIGCLNLIQDAKGKERIQVSHFGQIEPKVQLLQATVEGHYEMFLELS